MPDNTRPRIVPIPTDQSSVGIVPFNQNVSPELAAIIARASAPPAQPTAVPKQGVLETLLSSLATGVGIATSQSPGDALLNNLRTQQQQKIDAANRQTEYERQLDLLNRQFGLQVQRDVLSEQSDIRKEERQQAYNDKSKKDDFDRYLQKNNIEFQQQTELNKQQNEARKAAAILDHQWDIEKQNRIDERFDSQQRRLENKEIFDKKISMILGGIPVGKANTIANKMYNKEGLTDEESNTLTAAARRQLRLASGRSGGGTGSSNFNGLSEKDALRYLNTRMKDQFVVVKNPDGTESTIEMSNAIKDPITGGIQGLVRIANNEDKMNALSAEMGIIGSLVKNKGTVAAKPQQQLQPQDTQVPNLFGTGDFYNETKQKADHYFQVYKSLLDNGATPDLAKKMLREKIQQIAPQDLLIVDGVINKTSTNKTIKKRQTLGEIRKQSQIK